MKFLRRNTNRKIRLGKNSRKKEAWRKPKGRDNKMREKKRGYPAVVSIGYSNTKELRGKIEGKQPVIVNNLRELEKIGKNQIVILGKIGKKKKLEITKIANEKKIEIFNLNVRKFLKKNKIKGKEKK